MNARAHDAVAITGLGAICSLGATRHDAIKAILADESGFNDGPALEARPAEAVVVGEAKTPKNLVGLNAPDRTERLLREVIVQALDESQCDTKNRRTVVLLGTTLGGVRHMGEALRTDDASEYARVNNGAVALAALRDLDLPCGGISLSAACASGLSVIRAGTLLLEQDEADIVIAAGYDPISEFSLAGFMSLRLLAARGARPFEADRDGMTVAEGYAALVLERAHDAKTRGAHMHGFVVGAGERSDALHLTNPSPEGRGAREAIAAAFATAGAGLPSLYCAHATATPANDAAEFAAIQSQFGDALQHMPVTAFKSRLGHTLGAAGALELVLALSAAERNALPGARLGDTDEASFPHCDVRRGAGTPATIERIAAVSIGFGGANACVVVDRNEPPSTNASPTARVVLTGLGALLPGAPPCAGVSELDALLQTDNLGITQFDESTFSHLDDPRKVRRLVQLARFARACSRLTMNDAGLVEDDIAETDAIMASWHGPVEFSFPYYKEVVTDGVDMGNPLQFAESVPNIPSAQASLALGIRGATMTVFGTRTAALEALHLARLRLQAGIAERVLVLAVEEQHPLPAHVMRQMGVLNRRDSTEEPLVAGAIGVLLETESAAKSRGQTPLARLSETGVCWPRSGGVRSSIRAARELLAERLTPQHRAGLRRTASAATIGRIEAAIAPEAIGPTNNSVEMSVLSPMMSLLAVCNSAKSGAVFACDHHGACAVAALER